MLFLNPPTLLLLPLSLVPGSTLVYLIIGLMLPKVAFFNVPLRTTYPSKVLPTVALNPLRTVLVPTIDRTYLHRTVTVEWLLPLALTLVVRVEAPDIESTLPTSCLIRPKERLTPVL